MWQIITPIIIWGSSLIALMGITLLVDFVLKKCGLADWSDLICGGLAIIVCIGFFVGIALLLAYSASFWGLG